MKKTATALTVIATLALAGPAAAKMQVYKGKTSTGHPVTAKIDKGIIRYLVAGVSTTCLPIQSRGSSGKPSVAAEYFAVESTILKANKRHNRFQLQRKPAFHWREVTTNHDIWLKRRGNRISGRVRLQYQYMVSTFPIGTFNIYSCLGSATFKARAR